MRDDNKKFNWPTLAAQKARLRHLKKRAESDLSEADMTRVNNEIERVQGLIDNHPESQA